MKNVFIFSSSLRTNSNSNVLTNEFKKGAIESGNNVTFMDAKDINLKYCIGCLSCSVSGKCAIKDSMNEIYEIISNSDVLVFASPIYYYGISGQLKTFLDRLNPLYFKENKFKEVYLIFTAAENDGEVTYRRAKECVEGWVDCYEEVTLKKVIFSGECEKPNDVLSHKQDLLDAYEAGKNL